MKDFAFAEVFSDGVILQREKPLVIWGYGSDDVEVTVSLGPSTGKAIVSGGKWVCYLPPQESGVGMTLIANAAGQVIQCRDVMVGEVFLAGGQSNMEFLMRYETHWQEALTLKKNPMIRMYNCPRYAFKGQIRKQPECGFWFDDSNSAWECFSAIGYWFARYLQPTLGVPVGIVGCNWGGTSASAWIPTEVLVDSPLEVYLADYAQATRGQDNEELKRRSLEGWSFLETPFHKEEVSRVMTGMSRAQQKEHIRKYRNVPSIPMGPYNKNRPGGLYEYMFKKLVPFSFKAVLWYQGENDEHHAELYAKLFEVMISRWRTDLDDETLPFLFVQLPAFERWMELDGRNFPAIRAQQEKVSKKAKNCFMTTTMDLGMRYDIHPKEKKEIGRRLYLLAIERLYSKGNPGTPPELISCKREDNKITLLFEHCPGGLHAIGEIRSCFSIAQGGKLLWIKTLQIRNNALTLQVNGMDDTPVDVSFAEKPYISVRLFNAAGIPAKPFFVRE